MGNLVDKAAPQPVEATCPVECDHDWKHILRDSENGGYRRCRTCNKVELMEDIACQECGLMKEQHDDPKQFKPRPLAPVEEPIVEGLAEAEGRICLCEQCVESVVNYLLRANCPIAAQMVQKIDLERRAALTGNGATGGKG